MKPLVSVCFEVEAHHLCLSHAPGDKKARSVALRIPMLTLTVNFVSQVGGESTAHSGDVNSIVPEVVDQSIGDKGDLLGRSSKTNLVLNNKNQHSAKSVRSCFPSRPIPSSRL